MSERSSGAAEILNNVEPGSDLWVVISTLDGWGFTQDGVELPDPAQRNLRLCDGPVLRELIEALCETGSAD